MTRQPAPRLGLVLSGGGFRATLYHLGVIHYLRDIGALSRVVKICSVSGGSILAAHVILNWSRYAGGPDDFRSCAAELIRFTQGDVRGRIVRRWLFALLTGYRWIPFIGWTRTRLLQNAYNDLYGGKTLKNLGDASPLTPETPELYILATSLTTGALCSFSKRGFNMSRSEAPLAVEIDNLPVAMAVAASSAFPPLFPPVRLTRYDLHAAQPEFPDDQYLSDGGVFDNLGVRKLYELEQQDGETLDYVLVSDAQGQFDWALNKTYGFLPSRATRTSDLLMKRVSDLEYEIMQALSNTKRANFIRCCIQDEVPDHLAAMPMYLQRDSRAIRTDLDCFRPLEIEVLLRRGYSTAKNAWKGGSINVTLPDTSPSRPPEFTSQPEIEESITKGVADLRDSRNLKWRLWDASDLISWATLGVILLYLSVFAFPYIYERVRRTEAETETIALRTISNQYARNADVMSKRATYAESAYAKLRKQNEETGLELAVQRDRAKGLESSIAQLQTRLDTERDQNQILARILAATAPDPERGLRDILSNRTTSDERVRIAKEGGTTSAMLDAGLSHEAKGELAQAIRSYSEAIAVRPTAAAYYLKGRARALSGDYNAAIDDYNQAIRLDPRFVHALLERGIVYAGLGNYEKAEADLDGVARIDPKHKEEIAELRGLVEVFRLGGSAWYHKADPEKTTIRVVLRGSRANDTSLGVICKLTDLLYLDLGKTLITDSGLKYLEALQELMYLRLDGTKITDSGLKHLEKLADLVVLDLSNTGVTDAGLDSVARLRGLQQLSVQNTKVTKAGVKRLQDRMPKLKVKSD